MHLSTKCRYGVRALLSIAGAHGIQPVKRRDIAKQEGISAGYLENLLIALKNNGIIYTIRGAKGGYVLARSPRDITLLDVYHALEGPVAPVDCLENPDLCERQQRCVTRNVWNRIHKSIKNILQSTTLEALVRERKKTSKGGRHENRKIGD